MCKNIPYKLLFGLLLIMIFSSHLLLWVLYGLGIFNIIILIISISIQTFIIIIAIDFFRKYNNLKNEISKDPLTRIYNRQYFMDTLEKEISRSKRNNKNMAMVLFDVDDFKVINDNYGHYAGDQVLIRLTCIVQQIIRQYDTFGRLGGEEFAIILPEIEEKDAVELCERIRYQVEETRLSKKNSITISIGIAMLENDNDHHDLYQKSDDAMYRAKHCGKNQVVLYM